MKFVLMSLTLLLVIACGKDNKNGTTSAPVVPPVASPQLNGTCPNPNTNPNSYSGAPSTNSYGYSYNYGYNYNYNSYNQPQNNIYNTNGYCLNGQWISTNTTTGQTGYYDVNGQWVNTGPYYINSQGQYIPFNQYNGYYPQGGGFYRYPNTNGGWGYTWRGW